VLQVTWAAQAVLAALLTVALVKLEATPLQVDWQAPVDSKQAWVVQVPEVTWVALEGPLTPGRLKTRALMLTRIHFC